MVGCAIDLPSSAQAAPRTQTVTPDGHVFIGASRSRTSPRGSGTVRAPRRASSPLGRQKGSCRSVLRTLDDTVHTCASLDANVTLAPREARARGGGRGGACQRGASSNATVWTRCTARTASSCPCVVGGRAGSMPALAPLRSGAPTRALRRTSDRAGVAGRAGTAREPSSRQREPESPLRRRHRASGRPFSQWSVGTVLSCRNRSALGHGPAGLVEHPGGVFAGDAQIQTDGAACFHVNLLPRCLSDRSRWSAPPRHGPKATAWRRPVLMCCKRPSPRGPGYLPHLGQPWPGRAVALSSSRREDAPLPQRPTRRHPQSRPGCSGNLGIAARWWIHRRSPSKVAPRLEAVFLVPLMNPGAIGCSSNLRTRGWRWRMAHAQAAVAIARVDSSPPSASALARVACARIGTNWAPLLGGEALRCRH